MATTIGATSMQDDLNDILDRIGHEHRTWLVDLRKRFDIRQEPMTDGVGAVLAEPLFWFRTGDSVHACFGDGTGDEQRGADQPYRLLCFREGPA
ncbi:MAG: hypothetical protein R3B90_13625 [Planctomycetaceae bacterium]